LASTLQPEVAPSRLALPRTTLGSALLAAGLFLTHYRVVVYLCLVLAIATAWSIVRAARADRALVWPAIRLPLGVALLALVLCGPWLARLAGGFSLGLGGSGGQYAAAYYAVDRLGAALSQPAVIPLAVLAL